MSLDTYSMKDTMARCAECGKFMPWSRSVLVERSDGMPLPSPVYIETGTCVRCTPASKIPACRSTPAGAEPASRRGG